jgi:hypothetical protein
MGQRLSDSAGQGHSAMRTFLTLIVALLLIVGVESRLAQAQTSGDPAMRDATVVSQKKASERLILAAIGDSLGDGLWEGLYRRLHGDKRFTVFRGARHSVGFTGSDMTEQIDAAFAAGSVDALVIMIGANDDRRSFFINGRSVALFGSKKWIELYRGRIEKFMDHAGRRNVPLVWVLLPVMRTAEGTAAAQLTNEITTQAAQGRSHVTLVPTWNITADERGAYMPYFNDLRGRKRLMRHADGLHFTEPGYELLGQITFNRLLEVSPRFRAMVPGAAGTVVR